MIIMPVPKDIRQVKAKFIGPFTKRQTFAIIPAAVIGILIFTMFGSAFPPDFMVVLIVIFDVPILAVGFVDIYGMPLWVFAKDVAASKMLAPKDRPYETQNTYAAYAKQNKITYEYFDGDLEEYSAKELKKKSKINQKRLEKFLKENPDLKPLS